MALAITTGDAAFAVTEDSIFIPAANLVGAVSADFAADKTAAHKEGKTIFGVFERLATFAAAATEALLGYQVARDTISGVDANTFSANYSVLYQLALNEDTGAYEAIPVPTTGTLTGEGDFAFTDIFAGAAKVASGGNTAGAGVAIGMSGIGKYTGLTFAGINLANDCRLLLQAVLCHLVLDSIRRTTSVASAVANANRSNKTTATVPNAMIAATDPSSGIAPSDAYRYSIDSRTLSVGVSFAWDNLANSTALSVATL